MQFDVADNEVEPHKNDSGSCRVANEKTDESFRAEGETNWKFEKSSGV